MSFEERAGKKIGGMLDSIPGYKGYRDKEDRRDADHRVREQLALKLGAQTDRVETVARELANQRRLREIEPVDAFAQALHHLRDRVSTATYGYGGLFSDRDVDAQALDQIRQFDEAMIESADDLETPIKNLEAAYAKGSDLAAPANAGSAIVRQLGAQFDLRGQVVETAKPAPPESVLQVLNKPAPKPAPSSDAYNLHDRDALAILGDNYVVDARIDVEATPESFRLFRIAVNPETWLFVPKAPDQLYAKLQPAADPDESNTTIGGVTYQIQSSGSGQGQITGVGGQSDTQAVAYKLLTATGDKRAVILVWANERQVFTGSPVHREDVEIYGSTTSGS
ncbi:MAG TPA: hypothetical protein VFL82_07655 [Thermomicrobiales bacterium]|nr:hypothetical protein [Thermomicrobiales bacterium]